MPSSISCSREDRKVHKNVSTVRIILSSALKNAVLSIGTVAAVAGAIVTALIPPLVLERILNTLTEGKRPGIMLVSAYFGIILMAGLAESARESLLSVFGQRITRSLRHELCGKLSRLDTGCFVQQTPGEIVSRFVGDVDTVENLFTGGIIGMTADLGKIISILVVVFIKAPGLAWIIIALVPALYIFTRVIQKRMLRAQMDSRAAAASVSGFLPETLHCIRTVHLLGREGFMRKRYDEAIEEGYQATERTNFYDSVYSPVILIVSAAVTALVFVLSASGNPSLRHLFGMSAGTAVAVISYISQVFTPLESIGMEIQTVQSAVAGVHRINDFLALSEKETGSADAEKSDLCISVNKVDFAYTADTPVLENISLNIREGEHVTLTGRTGAGKSTLFKLLMGLYRPQKGSVRIMGREASDIPDSEKRHLFGCVEQHFYAPPGTIEEQITLFDPEITYEDAVKAAKLTGLHAAIMALPENYKTMFSEAHFSQGQRQLLAIARAVAADPKILLLDEITADLDAETEHCVLAALRFAAGGRTVVSISHRLYEEKGSRRVEIG